MSTHSQAFAPPQGFRDALAARVPSPAVRYLGGVLLLAAAYYGAAKLGQTLRYTASVSAIWPPAGLGIAVLYLWGLRWWPGLLLAELVVNGELLLGDAALPAGSLLGQQAGNMGELVVGALLLRRLVGPNAALDRTEQVVGMLVALGTATAISATMGTLSMLAGGVIAGGDALTFWRTWWLGDTSGGLVVLPLMLTWAPDPGAVMAARPYVGGRRDRRHRGRARRPGRLDRRAGDLHGLPGVDLGGLPIRAAGRVAGDRDSGGRGDRRDRQRGRAVLKQPIDHRTLSTQLYIAVAALTTLFLGAVVSERERSSLALAEAKRHEGEQAVEERHRIARDLHDSVSQSLFSTALHTRTAQRAWSRRA